MKFVLLVVTIGVLGTAWCETHEQQKNYAEVLVDTMEAFAEDAEDLLRSTDVTTQRGANVILIHANSFNFDIHYVLDCMQYLVFNHKEDSVALQATVSKLNNITNDLEKSFQNRVYMVKFQLQRSLKNVVNEAKNLQQIIRESQNPLYRSNVLRMLDDLVTGVQKLFFQAAVHGAPVKILLKTYLQVSYRAINMFLSVLNSEDVNIQNDIVRYSSKFSSEISMTVKILKDLTYTYQTHKENDVKEIIYSLSKICYDNEEVLYNETSFENINEQFRNSVKNVSKQLSKLVDAGFSDNGIFLKDQNLMYIVFPDIYAQSYKLLRNLEKTYENHVNDRSN